MDSKHRHELEENDLQAFLANFGEFWNKYGNKLLTAVLIFLVVVLAMRIIGWQRAAALEEGWSDVELTQTPTGLIEVANRHGDRTVQAVGRLRAADLLLQEVVMPQPKFDGETEGEAAAPADLTPEQKLEAAETQYLSVFNNKSLAPVFRHNAALGLAAVAEQRRDWDKARGLYEKLIQDAADFDFIVAQAKGRLAKLDVLPRPVTIAPDPEPVPSAADNDPMENLPIPGVGGPSLLDPGTFPKVEFDPLDPGQPNGADTPTSDTPAPEAAPVDPIPSTEPADEPAAP